jgi:hypothetical protein
MSRRSGPERRPTVGDELMPGTDVAMMRQPRVPSWERARVRSLVAATTVQ